MNLLQRKLILTTLRLRIRFPPWSIRVYGRVAQLDSASDYDHLFFSFFFFLPMSRRALRALLHGDPGNLVPLTRSWSRPRAPPAS
jgi:hypothetical protein